MSLFFAGVRIIWSCSSLLDDGIAIVLYLPFSLTKYSEIFAEVKGYFGILYPTISIDKGAHAPSKIRIGMNSITKSLLGFVDKESWAWCVHAPAEFGIRKKYSTINRLGLSQKMRGVACVTYPLRQIFAAVLKSTVPPSITLLHNFADVDDGIIGCERKVKVNCCLQSFATFASTWQLTVLLKSTYFSFADCCSSAPSWSNTSIWLAKQMTINSDMAALCWSATIDTTIISEVLPCNDLIADVDLLLKDNVLFDLVTFVDQQESQCEKKETKCKWSCHVWWSIKLKNQLKFESALMLMKSWCWKSLKSKSALTLFCGNRLKSKYAIIQMGIACFVALMNQSQILAQVQVYADYVCWSYGLTHQQCKGVAWNFCRESDGLTHQ